MLSSGSISDCFLNIGVRIGDNYINILYLHIYNSTHSSRTRSDLCIDGNFKFLGFLFMASFSILPLSSPQLQSYLLYEVLFAPALYSLTIWTRLNNIKVEVNELPNKSRSFICGSPGEFSVDTCVSITNAENPCQTCRNLKANQTCHKLPVILII